MRSESNRWSSRLAFNLATVGAAVGLGSIWRFPYLAGTNGGSAFIFVFVLACLAIATPLLVAEFIIGRRSRRNPPEAAGAFAAAVGRSRHWNIIGVLGTLACLIIMSSYTVIAGWVMAYAWKCASGELIGLARPWVAEHFRDFLASPWRVGAWHLGFIALVAAISARGVNRGVELANKFRAPALLILLLVLVAYSLMEGDVARGLAFALAPDFGKLSANVVLAAVGQAFYATGVGMAMMLAYGAYVPGQVSLVRSALLISGSIVVVSLLAAVVIFPLVFKYGLNPAQGSDLVFNVLPTAFAEMPGGRYVGTIFFLLLILAALTPTIAGMEPMVAWLQQRAALSRASGVLVTAIAIWVLGIGNVLSFNVWAHWHPLAWPARFQGMTVFDVFDFVSSNVLLPVGALLTCVLIGWLTPRHLSDEELASERGMVRRITRLLLRYVCPVAIAAVLVAGAATAAPMDRAVYERAEALLGANLESKVLNAFIVPRWIGSTDEFWYERQTAGGKQIVIVKAANGQRREPGDSERRAIEESVKAPEIAAGIVISANGDRGVSVRDGNLWLTDKTGAPLRALTIDGITDAGYGIWPDNWQANYIPRLRDGKPSAPIETQWAPNSRTLLVPYIDQRNVTPYPFLESAPVDGSFRPKAHSIRLALVGETPASFQWRLIDADTGAVRRVDLPYDKLLELQQDITAFRDARWSEDSTHLYLVAHGANLESAFLFDVDVATGAARTVIEEHIAPRTDLSSSPYSAVNVRVVRNGREAIWFSQRDGWGHLYRYDVRTGRQMNRITHGSWLVRDIIDIDEKKGIIYFTGGGREGGNPYYRYLYRVNFDGSNLTLLSPEPADHLLVPNKPFVLSLDDFKAYPPVSPSGKYVVYNYSRVDQPTRFVIRRVSNASLVAEVERADASALYAAGWRAPEEFSIKAADGQTDLWGVIYKPSDFDPTRNYPIIVAQYASPLTAVAPRHFYAAYRGKQPLAPSSYAELGFIVVAVDARGTAFRSKAFSQANYGALNRVGLDDHVAAIRALAAQHTYLDADRVGIVGHSYGGFVALRAMLEFPELFKVGIASAAMMDTQGIYADFHWSAYQGLPVYSDGTHRRPRPTEIAANWDALNASGQAERLQGKLLIQMGELDENVPPGQIMTFVSSLIRNNKDFELLYLPDRNHQFIGEGYVMRRDWDFMVRNLQGVEPPREYAIKVNRR